MKKLLKLTLSPLRNQPKNNTCHTSQNYRSIWLGRSRFVLCFIYLILPLSGQGQLKSIRFVDTNGALISTVDAATFQGEIYFPLETLRSVFDTNLTHKYASLTRQLVLNLRGKQIVLRIGSSVATLQPQATEIKLDTTVTLVNGDPYLPLTFFTRLIPQIYGHQATFNSSLAQIEFSKRQQVQHLQPDRQQYQNRQQKVVIINPGHGGNDTGGESLNGIREKDITLDLAKRIRRLCQEQKISVILTRIDDSDLRPSQRIQIATQHQGSFFLSLHCNMSFSTAVSGMEIWINNLKGQMRTQSQKVEKVDIFRPLLQDDYLEQSRQVAKIIQGRLELLSNDVVQIRENPLAILSGIYMPALLLELGYLSNLKDEAKLQNEKTRETIAGAIADAIGQFLEQSEL